MLDRGRFWTPTPAEGQAQFTARDVAVKVLRTEYGRDPDFVARFRQEAQAAASLNHPGIVGVFDYGAGADGPYIVMELVKGEDLATLLRRTGPLPPRQAGRLVAGNRRTLHHISLQLRFLKRRFHQRQLTGCDGRAAHQVGVGPRDLLRTQVAQADQQGRGQYGCRQTRARRHRPEPLVQL